MKSVTLNLIATNNYTVFLDPIIRSAKEFFATDCDLKFIVYTDHEYITTDEKITKIEIENEPWPLPTLKRFHYFLMAKNIIEKSDFSFYVDVDSLFLRKINISEIFKDSNGLVGTLHPGFIGNSGTPERNPNSKAYIPESSGNLYFCGGFFGGNSESFIRMSADISNSIDEDMANNIIAIWHDESHLNKYFLLNPPSIILGAGFTEPEGYADKNPVIVFLDKGGDTGKEILRNKK